jgi:hypothetical protein
MFFEQKEKTAVYSFSIGSTAGRVFENTYDPTALLLILFIGRSHVKYSRLYWKPWLDIMRIIL